MNFSPVRSGERVTPDIDLDNILRRMAGEYQEHGMVGAPPADEPPPRIRVYVQNNTTETFAQFAAVEIYALAGGSGDTDTAIYSIQKISAASSVIAVMEEMIEPGALTTAVILGGTWAWVLPRESGGWGQVGGGTYAAPSAQGLRLANYGYPVISIGYSVDGWSRCYIMLTGGITGSATPETFFRLGYRQEVGEPVSAGGDPVIRRFASVDRLQPVTGFERTQQYSSTSPALEVEIPPTMSGNANVFLHFTYVSGSSGSSAASMVGLAVSSDGADSRFDSRGLHPGVRLGYIYPPTGQVWQQYAQLNAGTLYLNRFENGTAMACWPVMASGVPSVQIANFGTPSFVRPPSSNTTFAEAEIASHGVNAMLYAALGVVSGSTYQAKYVLGNTSGFIATVMVINFGNLYSNPVHNFTNLQISFSDFYL